MSRRVDTERLRALAASATPGPWQPPRSVGGRWFTLYDGPYYTNSEAFDLAVAQTPRDAAYIAACSPDVILALLAEHRRYQQALERIAQGRTDGQSEALYALGYSSAVSRPATTTAQPTKERSACAEEGGL